MAREQHHIHTMAYAGETPWHGLGTKMDRHMTTHEALIAGGLDFEVELQDMYRYDRGNKLVNVPNQYATVRLDTDKVLGVVKGRYHVLQNREALAFFDTFLAKDEAHIETVGAMKGGRRIWALSKLPGEITVGGQDVIDKYLLISNSHDGSSGVQIRLTPIRVVCWNTLMAALGRRRRGNTGFDTVNNVYSIRHTASMKDQIEQAAKVMGIANKYYASLQEAYRAFQRVEMKQQDVTEFLNRCFKKEAESAKEGNGKDGKGSKRAQNILAEVNRLHEEGRGSDLPGVRGTLWGVYNAVTEYVDHERSYHNDDSRLDSMWFAGAGIETKQTAFDEAVKLIRV